MLITIEDDGTGFDVAHAAATSPRRGLGLLGIRERVVELRGTLRLESSPAKGTRLTVELPARLRHTGETNWTADAAAGVATVGRGTFDE